MITGDNRTAFSDSSAFDVWKNPIHFLASGFGAGTFPIMPGTCGTLIAIPFYLAMSAVFSPLYYALVLLVAIGFGCWICQIAEKDSGINDAPVIVWDEMIGFWLAMWMAPNGWQWVLSGFVLFRAFDILKPWPIKWLQQKLPGGIGIVADDLMAGLYTFLIIQIVVWLLFGLD